MAKETSEIWREDSHPNSPTNMLRVCHTGCSKFTLVAGSSVGSQFSTHCISCHLLHRELEQPRVNVVVRDGRLVKLSKETNQ